MKKEDLINCKVRVPTKEILEKLENKLLRELGFNGYIPRGAKYIFISKDSSAPSGVFVGWSCNDDFFKEDSHKEIPHTDIIGEESEDFKDRSELFLWASQGKPIIVCGKRYEIKAGGKYDCTFALELDKYKKSLPKPKPKEVVLYRYTYDGGDGINQTIWTSDEEMKLDKILKTETKTVILEG